MAVRAMAMDVGVGLGLAMGVDWKEAEACGGEEAKTPGVKSVGWVIHLLVTAVALVRTRPWRSLDL